MRLSDCFVDLVAYVAYFIKGVDRKQPPYEQVRAEIQRLVTESEGHMRNNAVAQDDYDLARFAVFAWIDEAILSSAWREKNRWQADKLQYRYYNTSDAGEIFFKKLSSLGPHQTDVRELYYLCLALGFKGQHCHQADEIVLKNLMDANLKVLTGSSVGIPSLERLQLFPGAYPDDSDATPRSRKFNRPGLFTTICVAVPITLFIVLFGVYQFVLSKVGNNLLELLPK
jgi:type VI secretion system protein ImpK